MPKYTADQLYTDFSQLGYARKGNPNYANDSTYWDGGHCNWGGMHRLREDCETMAREFTKMESLDDKTIADEIKNCTTKQEFDFKKNDLTRRVNELNSGLHIRTGYSSSMFGVCCIWGQEGMTHHVEDKLQECRRDLDRLKGQLGQTQYQWVEELKRVQFEIKEIEARMEENKRRAMKEKDPIAKQKILAEIEADGKLLQAKYEERNKYTDKFKYIDISKHVSGLVERLKRAVEGSNKGGSGSGGGGNPNRPNKPNQDPNNPFSFPSGGSSDDLDGNNPDRTPRGRRPAQSEQKDNQHLILIAITVVIALFFLMNQKEDHPTQRDYKYYDY